MEMVTEPNAQQQQLWLEKIRTMEHELDRLANLNGEISVKVTDKDNIKKVEHFQNQFIVQKGRLDEMKHNVKLFKSNPGLEEYESYLNDLIDEFNGFAGSVN